MRVAVTSTDSWTGGIFCVLDWKVVFALGPVCAKAAAEIRRQNPSRIALGFNDIGHPQVPHFIDGTACIRYAMGIATTTPSTGRFGDDGVQSLRALVVAAMKSLDWLAGIQSATQARRFVLLREGPLAPAALIHFW